MIPRSTKHLLFAVLAMSATLAPARSSHAQDWGDPNRVQSSASLQINFGSARHWVGVSGTRVQELPAAERPDYDMFRYGDTYYVYNNNRWYSSPRESGEFRYIDEGSVPGEFSNVPRDHWRNYPSSWQNRRGPSNGGTSASLRVTFGGAPNWTRVQGTEIEEMPMSDQRDYDVFRYRGTYYAYQNDRWYSSRQDRGDYSPMGDRDVPDEFTNIPRDHWRNDPSNWWDRRGPSNGGTSASLRVTFGSAPSWTRVQGTEIEQVPMSDQRDYDVFRYRGTYYAHRNDRWYSSRQDRGDYSPVGDRDVPAEFSNIPRDRWHQYPGSWEGRDRLREMAPATMRVNLGYGQRWYSVPGTRVYQIRGDRRPAYDVFRYRRNYYIYASHRWYGSRYDRGEFRLMDDRAVPFAVLQVPRRHWQEYPGSWQHADAYGRGDGR